jgi:hypothetical protein
MIRGRCQIRGGLVLNTKGAGAINDGGRGGANYEGGLVVPKARGWFQNKMGSWSQI